MGRNKILTIAFALCVSMVAVVLIFIAYEVPVWRQYENRPEEDMAVVGPEVVVVIDRGSVDRVLLVASESVRAAMRVEYLDGGDAVMRLPHYEASRLLVDIAFSNEFASRMNDGEIKHDPFVVILETAIANARVDTVPVEHIEIILKVPLDDVLVGLLGEEGGAVVRRVGVREDGYALLHIAREDVVTVMLRVWDTEVGSENEDERSRLRAILSVLDRAALDARIDVGADDRIISRIRLRSEEDERRREEVASVVVGGDIVDQDGNRLNQVSVKASRVVLPPFSVRESVRYEAIAEEVVDGSFNYKAYGAIDMVLTFSKPGYYLEEFGTHMMRRDGSVGFGVGDRFDKRDIRIVMRRIVEPDKLRDFRQGELRFRIDGSCVAINFDVASVGLSDNRNHVGQSINYRPMPRMFHAEIAGADIDDIASIVPHGISVIAEVGDAGRLALAPYTPPMGALQEGPRSIILRVHDSDGGFIAYKSTKEPAEGRSIMRGMRMAPGEGYYREWVLTALDLEELQYFYIRSRGHYGKGEIRYVVVDRDGVGLSVHMRVLLQVEPGVASVASND